MAVFMLALGIGATTAAVNVAASVLLTRLPVEEESRLLLVSKRLPAGSTLIPYSTAEIAAWGEASRTLERVAGVQYDGAWPYPAEFGDRASTVMGALVSGSFFDVLGARPALGKLLHVDDARAGSEAVAVIGYGLWRRRFGGNPAVVGQRLRVYGQQVTIVGVAPPGFAFPDGAEVWRPLRARARAALYLKPVAPVAVSAGEAVTWENKADEIYPGAHAWIVETLEHPNANQCRRVR